MRAKEEVELHEIFRLANIDHSGYIDETAELFNLSKAVNPNFIPEKCHVLLNKMDMRRDGQSSPMEFIEFVFKFMEAFTSPQREKGLKKMRQAAEGLARKAEEACKVTYEACGLQVTLVVSSVLDLIFDEVVVSV